MFSPAIVENRTFSPISTVLTGTNDGQIRKLQE